MSNIESVIKYTHQYLNDFKPYKGGKWCYEDGIILSGSEYLYEATKDNAYNEFILNYLDKGIDEDGKLAQYKQEDYNIDNINAGKVLFDAYAQTNKEKFKKAMDTLFAQLETHPRTQSGSFWHKKRYPNQIWLDGLYMGQPYYARYIKEFTDSDNYEDILNQFRNVKKYLWDSERELYIHAYDETYSMQWADKETGKAPNVWSRAVGWVAMALVDVMEICNNQEITKELSALLVEQIDGMLSYQTEEGMWYQVVDKLDLEGNYLETSGTLMIAYAILKGVRLGYLDQKYLEFGLKAYEGTINKYFYEEDGKFHLGGICEVAGLDNEKRDGSVEYYLSERVVVDEAKGVAPFFMTIAEVIKLNQ
ncbi:unsaturated rhamnogalacturonyl hydrolase [Natranaerovirga pectinivora]|uniref:Unsaturated rhamnogalacturonyl hydrolase n=1 Tax=Natranaerovirga pectinivora TaxID=682400 RepID=A0A4R3MJH4_9FIRM|nr:glycoside hydrolase family 88 protein [Natranaerovirga pectinivora]TCT13835.1 unsaturated rhamnogalacturonyl hydrolase [Natranaerovirga pectinivora]